jgi:hypothetical protein
MGHAAISITMDSDGHIFEGVQDDLTDGPARERARSAAEPWVLPAPVVPIVHKRRGASTDELRTAIASSEAFLETEESHHPCEGDVAERMQLVDEKTGLAAQEEALEHSPSRVDVAGRSQHKRRSTATRVVGGVFSLALIVFIFVGVIPQFASYEVAWQWSAQPGGLWDSRPSRTCRPDTSPR